MGPAIDTMVGAIGDGFVAEIAFRTGIEVGTKVKLGYF